MELTKQAILKHKQDIEGLDGYIVVINEIENNVSVNPDIAIESCKSLIEGLSKKALELLSEEYQTNKGVRKLCDNKLPVLVTKAFECVYKNKFEIDIHNSLYKLIKGKDKLNKFIKLNSDAIFENANDAIQKIVAIRDNRGDISHGRIYPKKEESEIQLAKSIVSITDGICSFMIYEFASQYQILESQLEKLIYNNEFTFNEWLDRKYDIFSVKIDYSKLLYKNAYVKYEELYYSEFLPIIEQEIVEDEINEEPNKELEVVEKETNPKSQVLTEEEAKALYEKHFNSGQKPKEVIQLTTTFNETTFWSENRMQALNQFAEKNDLLVDGLKKVIETYIAFDDEPRRDVIAPIMKYPPSLADRRTVLLVMLEDVIAFANELKEIQ